MQNSKKFVLQLCQAFMALSNVVKRSVLSKLNKTANDGRYDPCTNVVGIHTAAFKRQLSAMLSNI